MCVLKHGIAEKPPWSLFGGVVLLACLSSAAAAGLRVPVAANAAARESISMVFEAANPNPEILRLLEFAGHLVAPGAATPAVPPDGPSSPPVQWRLVYRNIYPGIDLAAYRSGGRIQYDLIVAPGAELAQVRIVYQGLEHVELRGTFPGYQVINGVRVEVPVKIVRSEKQAYALQPVPYDGRSELVIPTTQTPLTAVTTSVASR
jgi:hypothetical protein